MRVSVLIAGHGLRDLEPVHLGGSLSGPPLAQEDAGGHGEESEHSSCDTNTNADLSGFGDSGRARLF